MRERPRASHQHFQRKAVPRVCVKSERVVHEIQLSMLVPTSLGRRGRAKRLSQPGTRAAAGVGGAARACGGPSWATSHRRRESISPEREPIEPVEAGWRWGLEMREGNR
eukprot:344298-Prorocentrum_minimum.AAC.1